MNVVKLRWWVARAVAVSVSSLLGVTAIVGEAKAAPPAADETSAGPGEAGESGESGEPAETEEQRAQRELAQRLYEEGSASFSAADYEDAIEKFTAVLRIAETSDTFGHHVRSALLLNLARSHRYQYRIDHDLKRLRLALDIYERLLREAEANLYPAEDVEEGQEGRAEVIAEIEEREASAGPTTPTQAPEDLEPSEPEHKRGPALGLMVGGSVLTAAGIGFIVLGTRYGPRAEREADGRSDLDAQVIDEFLAKERGKGRGWIIGGAVASAAGVGMLVTGAILFAKHKHKPSAQALRFTPTMTLQPGYSGVGLVGQF